MEGSVTNLKMCYGESVDNFLLSLVEEGLRRKMRTYLEKISLDLEKGKQLQMQLECCE
jgi:hypothetical protein